MIKLLGKVQLKYANPELEQSGDKEAATPALRLIVKWGGELTTAGV